MLAGTPKIADFLTQLRVMAASIQTMEHSASFGMARSASSEGMMGRDDSQETAI